MDGEGLVFGRNYKMGRKSLILKIDGMSVYYVKLQGLKK